MARKEENPNRRVRKGGKKKKSVRNDTTFKILIRINT